MAQIQHSDPVWTSLRRAPDDTRPPAPLVLGIAFACLLGWAGAVSVLDLPAAVAVGGAVVIAAGASWWLTIPAALGSAALAFLVVDGFVLGRLGDLSWDGTPDAVLLVVLVLACALSSEACHEVHAARLQRADLNKP